MLSGSGCPQFALKFSRNAWLISNLDPVRCAHITTIKILPMEVYSVQYSVQFLTRRMIIFLTEHLKFYHFILHIAREILSLTVVIVSDPKRSEGANQIKSS